MPAKATLQARTDNYNNTIRSTLLNRLKIDPVDTFTSHKVADTHLAALSETIKKQGGQAFITNNQLITVSVPQENKKKEKGVVPKAAPKAAPKATPTLKAEKDTVDLIEAILSANKTAGDEWYKTGQWIFTRKELFKSTDAKENRKLAYKALDTGSDGAVPEKGLNNSGETITLRKQNGSVKWSAWSETRLWTQYLARIFQAIETSGWDAVFPKGDLVTKDDINKLTKKEGDGESPYDTFRRSVMLAEQKVENCTVGDVSAMEVLLMDLNAKFAEFKKNVAKK